MKQCPESVKTQHYEYILPDVPVPVLTKYSWMVKPKWLFYNENIYKEKYSQDFNTVKFPPNGVVVICEAAGVSIHIAFTKDDPALTDLLVNQSLFLIRDIQTNHYKLSVI